MKGYSTVLARPSPYGSYGFTLLEIMLVLTIMAVAVAVVVPRFFAGVGASLDGESRRLQVALNLAEEEAQIYGVPVRWTASAHAYRFQKWDTDGKWDAMEEPALKPYALPAGIGIAGVKQGHAASLSAMMLPADAANEAGPDKDTAAPPVGQVLFWPDGSLTVADIELVRNVPGIRKPADVRLLRLRPGADGIRIADGSG